MNDKKEILHTICEQFFLDAYQDNWNTKELNRAISNNPDTKFISQLIVYLMESVDIPSSDIRLFLIIGMLDSHQGDSLMSHLIERIVTSPLDIIKLMEIYQITNSKNDKYIIKEGRGNSQYSVRKRLYRMSNQLLKGIGRSLCKFSEADFRACLTPDTDNAITFKDAIALSHPNPITEEQSRLFSKILKSELEPYKSIDDLLLESKKRGKSYRAIWEGVIDSDNLPYLEGMNMLPYILSQGISHRHVIKLCSQIKNYEVIAKKHITPFDYVAPFRAIANVEGAEDKDSYIQLIKNSMGYGASILTTPFFKSTDSIVIASDVSYDMQVAVDKVRDSSNFKANERLFAIDIGPMLGRVLSGKCSRVISGTFANSFKVEGNISHHPLSDMVDVRASSQFSDTPLNAYKIIRFLSKAKVRANKVLIFTNSRYWGDVDNHYNLVVEWIDYIGEYPDAQLYLFDISDNKPYIAVEENDVSVIYGWDNRVFDVLHMIEHKEEVISEIEKVYLRK